MVLGLIFGFLGFLISPFGLMALFGGIALFLLLPVISLVSRFKVFSRLFLKLAVFPLDRAAVVISEHNDALFKQMRFDGLGYETINIDGEEKVFEDPDSALHYFLGIPFALANEEHGVLFDPRHAALGTRKKKRDDRGEGEYVATKDEWDEFGVSIWKPAVFEFPNKHELVNLSHVKELIGGGERSEFAERVETLYEHSRDPFSDGGSASKYLFPILGFAITFGGIWFMISQFGLPSAITGGGGGGGTSPDSTVSYGGNNTNATGNATNASAALLLLLLSSLGIDNPKDVPRKIKNWLQRRDWMLFAGICGLVGGPLLVIALLALFVGVVVTGFVLVAVSMGFMFLPFMTVIAQPSRAVSGVLSSLYFKLGFLGYRQPVIEWTPRKYQLREEDDLDMTDDVEYYNLFGTVVGFTFEPGKESWDAEVEKRSELEAQQPVTDGGERTIDSNLPAKYVRSEEISVDNYGGYIPKRIDGTKYYVNTHVALNRMVNAANGEKSLRKLLEAKEIHGDSNAGLDEEMVFKTTATAGAFGVIMGLGIFVVPALL